MIGIQRAFYDIWRFQLKLLKGRGFSCRKEGLVSFLDNRKRKRQIIRCKTKIHNVLSTSVLATLYNSKSRAKDSSKGYQTRLVLWIGILTGIIPTDHFQIVVDKFKMVKLSDEVVWKL